MSYILSIPSGNASKTPNILRAGFGQPESSGSGVSVSGGGLRSPRVVALLERTRRNRGRLIFALDATASREPTWDMASHLTSAMFEEAARLGTLDVQLAYYRGGVDEFRASPWFADVYELASQMSMIRCEAGATKINRVLEHIRTEHAREKVSATVLITDACEEPPENLYAAATGLGTPVFCFQEGSGVAIRLDQHGEFVVDHHPETVEAVLRRIALLTGGAWARFDAGAAAKLGELLAAVAAFAVGGIAALGDLRSESARKLLTQMRGGAS